jgi:UDP-hydrolysing UDP-N-acetyl-D-glucosamine 2-epimerase
MDNLFKNKKYIYIMKNICVITGTRAEYGYLKSIMTEINNSNEFNLILFVTGSHLEDKYGLTYKTIENDGFKINEKIYMNLNDDSPNGILQSMSKELSSLSKCFNKYKIDLILFDGDRYELLPAANCALIYNIPIGHIGGGDITEGAYDNAIRNAITKMATYHFVTCESSYNNIIKMNESENNIYLIGNAGYDEILNFNPLESDVFYSELNIEIKENLILVIYHSETLTKKADNINNLKIFLDSLLGIKKFNDTNFIIIHSNADSFNSVIFEETNKLSNKFNNIYTFKSLDRYNYLNLIYFSNLVIGNSSSGIYEVPLFNKITLNIGNRQKGRDHGNSVINLNYNKENIINMINNILDNKFKIDKITYPYKLLNSSKILIDILKKNFK